MALSDADIQAMAWRNAIRSSMSGGDHGSVKVSKFFSLKDQTDVDNVARGHPGLWVAAGWIDGELSWILLTRRLIFKDTHWKSVSPWDANIAWGDFKGHDKESYRMAPVKSNGQLIGVFKYETGKASMIPMNAILTISRLRRPVDA